MANVRRRTQQEKALNPKTNYNRMSTMATEQAASGTTASWEAEKREYENQVRKNSGKKAKVVKVDSNPVPTGRTRIGNLAGGVGRAGGLGGGMNWSTK